jgi:hypothetical protein
VPRSSRFTKKSFVSEPGVVVKDAVRGLFGVRPQDAEPAHEHCHLRCAQREQICLVHKEELGREPVALAQVVTEAVHGRLERREGLHIRELLRCVHASRCERHLDVVAGVLRRPLHGRAAAQHDQVGQRDLLGGL